MGWNDGYTAYERTVVNLYDSGQLTPDLMRSIIEPYRNTDLDHGGCMHLRTIDGLSADEVVVKLLSPEFWDNYLSMGAEADYEDFYATWQDIIMQTC